MLSSRAASTASPEINPDDQEYGVVWVQDMMTDTDDILIEGFLDEDSRDGGIRDYSLHSNEFHCYQLDGQYRKEIVPEDETQVERVYQADTPSRMQVP
jgi:hypothetical protein